MWGLGVGGERLLISLTGDMIRKACSKEPKKPLAAPWNRKKRVSNETHLGVKTAIYSLGCSHHPTSPCPRALGAQGRRVALPRGPWALCSGHPCTLSGGRIAKPGPALSVLPKPVYGNKPAAARGDPLENHHPLHTRSARLRCVERKPARSRGPRDGRRASLLPGWHLGRGERARGRHG